MSVGVLLAGFGALGVLRMVWGEKPRESESLISTLSDQTEVIFVGSSHVAYGFNPALFEVEALTLASGALNYENMFPLVMRALKYAPNLKVCVLEADIFPLRVDSLENYNGDYQSLYRLGLRLNDLNLSRYTKCMQRVREHPLLYPVFFQPRLSPYVLSWDNSSQELVRMNPAEGLGHTIATKGYESLDQVINEKNDGHVILEYHRSDLKKDYTRENTKSLRALLDGLVEKGIHVLLIRLPHHATYYENRPDEWNRQYDGVFLNQSSGQLGAGVDYLDWDNHADFLDADFGDGHHLNKSGAAKLAELIGAKIDGYVEAQKEQK